MSEQTFPRVRINEVPYWHFVVLSYSKDTEPWMVKNHLESPRGVRKVLVSRGAFSKTVGARTWVTHLGPATDEWRAHLRQQEGEALKPHPNPACPAHHQLVLLYGCPCSPWPGPTPASAAPAPSPSPEEIIEQDAALHGQDPLEPSCTYPPKPIKPMDIAGPVRRVPRPEHERMPRSEFDLLEQEAYMEAVERFTKYPGCWNNASGMVITLDPWVAADIKTIIDHHRGAKR